MIIKNNIFGIWNLHNSFHITYIVPIYLKESCNYAISILGHDIPITNEIFESNMQQIVLGDMFVKLYVFYRNEISFYIIGRYHYIGNDNLKKETINIKRNKHIIRYFNNYYDNQRQI